MSDTREEISQETKDELKKIEITEIFGKEKPQFQRLGIGIHNNHYYIGSSIWLNEEQLSVIITDEKKYYIGYKNTKPKNKYEEKFMDKKFNQIKENFGLNYKIEFEEESLDFSWKNKEIKTFLENKHKKYTTKELFKKIKKTIKENMIFGDERSYAFFACDIMTTYFLPIFNHMVRIQFRGNPQSGKTKITELYHLMSFNSFWISGISISDLFRTLESICGTPCIDNFDGLEEELVKATNQIYETGFSAMSSYRRRERGARGQFVSGKFRNFSKIILNGVEGLTGRATESRTLIFNLIEPPDSKELLAIKNKKVKDNKNFEEIRNDLRNHTLENWETIKKNYEEIEEKKISGREADLLKPVLSVAKAIDKKTYLDILSFCSEVLETQKIIELETDEDYQLLMLLDELVDGKKFEISNKELGEQFISRYYGDFEGDIYKKLKYKFQKRIPEMLKLTGKIGFRKGHAGKLIYVIERVKLDYILKSRKYKNEPEIMYNGGCGGGGVHPGMVEGYKIQTEKGVKSLENKEEPQHNTPTTTTHTPNPPLQPCPNFSGSCILCHEIRSDLDSKGVCYDCLSKELHK